MRGTYWRERDAHRQAARPAHAIVDPLPWERAKKEAAQVGTSLGELLGQLVVRAARGDQGAAVPPRSDDHAVTGDQSRLFTRIAVDKATWASFVSRAHTDHLTVARYLGVVVEKAFPSKVDR